MSAAQQQSLKTAYFGKIPSRGDFVKNANHPQLVATLDSWLAATMERLAQDPGWKTLYDQARPLDFAFLGSRSKLAVAGHFIPSRDASNRRFPFLAAAPMDAGRPLEFIARSPMALSRIWSQLSGATAELERLPDASGALHVLGELVLQAAPASNDGFGSFVDLQTIERVEQMLRHNGHTLRLHDTIIAIGLLLQPVMSSASSHLEKGLILPLPEDPLYRNLMAQFWMTLLTPFLARADFELSLFIGLIGGKERLAVGFKGASSGTLCSLLSSPQALQEGNVVLEETPWVASHLRDSHGLAKLSSYLDQPRLSLRQAIDTFREVFVGA